MGRDKVGFPLQIEAETGAVARAWKPLLHGLNALQACALILLQEGPQGMTKHC